jgi:hypothetical protein
MRGTLHVTCEEGTHSAWLYDLLVRRVAKLVVCNPRKNALLTLARKIAAITLKIWKKGEAFDAEHLKRQAA